jgi:phosphomannomutase
VLITEKGAPFGEEYTIAQTVKFVLSKTPGAVTINLSTTRAVEDIAGEFNCEVYRSPVGEANVVKKMKETGSVIGGEGSGGVIYPALHYGRDALVGTVITLQHLLEFGGTLSELKHSLPAYSIVKKKIEIGSANPDAILDAMAEAYAGERISTDDGLRIDFEKYWVHLRKSNTEPIIRVIAEASDAREAEAYCDDFFRQIQERIQDVG